VISTFCLDAIMVGKASALPASGILGRQDWLLIVIALPIIAVLALGAHDLAISYLGIPYPRWQLPTWINAIGQTSKVGGALLLYRCAGAYFRSRSLLSAIFTLGFLLVFLHEALRVTLIELTITEAWVDGSWVNLLVGEIPRLLPLAYAVLAVPIGRFTSGKPALAVLLVCAAGALVAYAVSPGLEAIPPAISSHFSLVEPHEVHKPPYDWFTYRVIYPTFIEATIACFCLAILVWPALRGSEGTKIVQFTALILLARGRVAGQLLNTLWIQDQSYPMALASFGQFFVETVILAALTGWVWSRVTSLKALA
jgi:hypothetical protein